MLKTRKILAADPADNLSRLQIRKGMRLGGVRTEKRTVWCARVSSRR